jgi:hypothetical protein
MGWTTRAEARVPVRVKILTSSQHPVWLLGLPNLLSNGYTRANIRQVYKQSEGTLAKVKRKRLD